MVKGIISSVILALADGCVFFIPYNRKSEPAKFFTLYGIVLLSALGYIIWQTTTIPDDITREMTNSYMFLTMFFPPRSWNRFYSMSLGRSTAAGSTFPGFGNI